MANQARKIHPEIEPDIKPNLRVVGNDEPDKTAQNLAADEDSVGRANLRAIQGGGETTPGRANLKSVDSNDSNKNIDDVREKEDNPFGYSYINKKGKEKLTGRAKLLKRLGPVGLLVLIFGGGGGILMTLLTPGIALVHIKETVEQKVDTMSSVVENRSNLLLKTRLNGGTRKALSRYAMWDKYSTFGKAQVETMQANNMDVLDKNGKPVEPDSKGRYRGVRYLAYSSDGGDTVKRVTARQYQRQLIRDVQFRGIMNKVYPTRFAVWKDRVAVKVALLQKWSHNPKSITAETGGDADANKKEYNKNLAENNVGGDDVVDELPDGVGDFDNAIAEQASELDDNLDNGKPNRLIVRPGEVLQMPETDVKSSVFGKVGKGVVGTFSVTDVATGACGTYRYGQALVFAAKVIAGAQMIRYASNMLATADKIKAGAATANDVALAMTMLYATNTYGQSFGDSAGYHYAAYGKTTSTPVALAGTGNPVFSMISNTVRKANSATGGNTGEVCRVVLNPVSQAASVIAGVIAAVFSLGGSTAVIKGGEVVGKAGAKALVKKLVEQTTKKFTEKFASREAAMASLKQGGKDFVKYSSQIIGFAIAGKIIGAFLTPYLAHLAAGTLFGGDQDGVAAMDAMVSGAALMSASVAQQRGLTPLTREQALAYNDFNNSSKATYVADRQREADPLDGYDPYSATSNIGFALSTTMAPQKIAQNPASLLAVPSKILATISNPSTAHASTSQEDLKAVMNECDDEDMKSTGLATDVFCNPIYGFPDVSMVKEKLPDDVAGWMFDNKYIDADGNPIGDYADYVDKCFGDTTPVQVISPLLSDTDSALPSECYTDTDSTKSKYWHLYQIDNTVIDTADNGFPVPTLSNTSNPGAEFTVASYNIRNIFQSKGETLASETSRYNKIVDNIKSKGSDGKGISIVGMQELEGSEEYGFFKQHLSDKYNVYPSNLPNPNGQAGVQSRSIFYRKDLFDVVNSTEMSFQRQGVTAYAPVLWLKYKSTGQIFAVMNTHNSANSAEPNAPLERKRAADVYINQIKQITAEKTPLVFTGDFNEGYGVRSAGNTTYEKDWHNLFYCQAVNAGLMLSAEDKNDAVECKRSGNGGVDYIYHSPEIVVNKFEKIPKGASGSDHSVPYADLEIPAGSLANAPSGTINVATFNIRHSGRPGELGYATWRSRLAKASATIYNNKLDVVGLQEARPDQQALILENGYLGGNSYATYKKWPTGQKRPGFTPNAVLYNAEKYEVVQKDTKLLPIEYDNGKKIDVFVQLKLKERGGNGSFYILNTHDPADVRPGSAATNNRSRIENTKMYIDLIDKLSKESIPIFLTGDFNSKYGTNPQTDPSCMLSKSGIVKDTWEMYKNISGCAAGRPVGIEIDRIYTNKELEVKTYKAIAKGSPSLDLNSGNGSDHATIINTIDFGQNSNPTLVKGGERVFGNGYARVCSGSRPPVSAIECSYQCVDYVKYVLINFYNAKYRGGTLGNGKDVVNTLAKLGYKKDTTPAVGAIMSTSATSTPQWGHTAVVSKVNVSGGKLVSFVVEEYNWTHKLRYDRRTIPASDIQAKGMTFAHTEVDLK